MPMAGHARDGLATNSARSTTASHGATWTAHACQMGSQEPLDSQIRFVLEADQLKTVVRQNPISDRSRMENSAEHSWHLALMALVLAEHAPPGTDLGRVMAMVVIHDLVEIDAGDLFVYADAEAQTRQEEAERAAAERIFAILPAQQAVAMRALWDEFEERRTPEARFARALDRLHPMLLNLAIGGTTWTKARVTLEQVLSKVTLIQEGSNSLGAYARTMISKAAERGVFSAGAAPGVASEIPVADHTNNT